MYEQEKIEFLKLVGTGLNARQMSEKIGVKRKTVSNWLKKHKIPKSKSEPYVIQSGKHFFPKTNRYNPYQGIDGTVLVLPDMHDSPKKNKDRFYKAGLWCAVNMPDYIISIGDFLDFESLCSHVRPHTKTAREKPLFIDEMASGAKALSEFNRGLATNPDYKPKKIITLGNHEHRAWLWEDENPEDAGMKTAQVLNMFTSYGWEPHPFGKHVTVLNVDFTHIPKSIMGKPIGGQNVATTVGNKSIRDTVFGHTHKYNVITAPKTGDNNKITVVEVGCGLPDGEIENYAKLSMTGWWWGIVALSIKDGRIDGVNAIPMRIIEDDS